MDEFSMRVVEKIDLSCALTALSMTRMTSLTKILLVHFITNITFALSLNSHMQKEPEHFGRLTVRLDVKNFHMVRSTLAHAQMNYHCLQFGHQNQDKADTKRNW
jgi:hypothetical protein